jgi:ribosomal protein L2
MLEGSMRPMRAGETEKERRSIPDPSAEHGERMGEMDPVYGGGIGQKGEDCPTTPQKKPKLEDKIQKDTD